MFMKLKNQRPGPKGAAEPVGKKLRSTNFEASHSVSFSALLFELLSLGTLFSKTWNLCSTPIQKEIKCNVIYRNVSVPRFSLRTRQIMS
jgi:hypothetical protein